MELGAPTPFYGSDFANVSGPFDRLLPCFGLLALPKTTESVEAGSEIGFWGVGEGYCPC